MRARWRVVRLPGGTDACTHRHRFERFAWRCARRHERAEPIGVFFTVRPVLAGARKWRHNTNSNPEQS